MFRRLCLTLGLGLFCLNAAAKAPALSSPLAQDLPVEVVLNQNEIAVDVPATASAVGMQFGLLGAIIGSSIQNAQTSNAEERIVPVRDLLVSYRFNERMEAAIRAKLASEGISPNPQITVRATPWDAREAATASDQPATTQVLVLTPRYAMTNDFQLMTVSLMTSLVERTRKANGKYKNKILFSRNYRFEFVTVASEGKDEMAQLWTRMGSAGLASLLDQGIEQSTDMLVHDFSAAGRAWWTSKAAKNAPSPTLLGQKFSGRQVHQGENYIWTRSGSGAFQQIQGHRVLDDAAVAQLAAMTAAPAPTVAAAPAEQAAAPAAAPAAVPAAAPATDAAPAPAEAAAAPVGSGN
jgi:hypothetical protein